MFPTLCLSTVIYAGRHGIVGKFSIVFGIEKPCKVSHSLAKLVVPIVIRCLCLNAKV